MEKKIKEWGNSKMANEAGLFKQVEGKWQQVNKAYWEAAEKFEKSTKIPFFTSFVAPLEEKRISSLLVLIAMFLILVGGAAFFAFQQGSFSSSVFTVKVLGEDGTPVSGVDVTLTQVDGNASQTSRATNGIATFNLPAGKRYALEVSGELEPSTSVVVMQPGRTQIIRLAPKQATASNFLLVQNSIGSPLPNAVVEYSIGGENVKTSRTNSSGYAPLYIEEDAGGVNGNVSASNYESASFSFLSLSTGAKVHKVTLLGQLKGKAIDLSVLAVQRRTIASPLNPVPNGKMSVNVNQLSDVGFRPVGNAYVALYNGFSKTRIAEGHTNAAGVADFAAIPYENDFNIYAVVEADGFVTFITDQARFQNGLVLNVTLSHATAENSFDFLVKLRGDVTNVSIENVNNAASASGDVYLLSTQGAVISTRPNVNGQVVFRGLPKQNFYVAVTSPGIVRFVSPLVTPESVEFTAVLKPANATTSGTLSLKVTDFDGNSVSVASVNLFISNVLSPPEAKSNSLGVAVFSNVPLHIPISIKGEKNSFIGQVTTTLTANGNATLVLKPPTGSVSLSIIDYATNQPLYNSDVKLFYKATPTELIEIPTNCTLTSEVPACTLSLVSTITYVAKATASGFYTSSAEFQAAPYGHTDVRLRMFPSSFSQQSIFLGIFDAEDGHKLEVNENLSMGKLYAAKFSLKTNKGLSAASSYGLYVRIGDAGQSFYSSNQPAGIAFISQEFSPVASLFYNQLANASATYSAGSCSSTIESSGFGLYKWAFSGGVPSNAAADFTEVNVPIAAITPGSTKLEYFTLTQFSDENQGENHEAARVIREPTDVTLGEALSTSGKKWCDSRTQSIQLNVEKKDDVKCNVYSCIKTWLTQGETPSASYFQAQATEVVHQNLDLHYSILDFQQTPTILSFSPPQDVLKLDAASTQPSDAVNPGLNTFALTLNAFKSNGSISSIVQPRRSSQTLSLTYGSKISSNPINLEVLAPPAPAVNLASLGTRYEISYDKMGQKLQLLDERGRPTQQIDMYTDPLLPADAVFVYLNYSSSPCDSGENNFQQVLVQDSACFELTDVPAELVDNPPAGLKLLKYDASTPACSSHSIDLNKVNEASAKITVQHACTPASSTFDIKVKQRAELVGNDLYKGLSAQVVFTEPSNDLGEGTNPFDEAPHSLWALLVNRQHSKTQNVNLGGINGYLLDQNNGQGIYQLPGSTSVKSTRLDGRDFFQELGISTPAFLQALFTNGVKDKQIQADFQSLRQQVGIIASNTVFRRAPPGCVIDPTCKLKTFPYNVFQPNKDFSFQLGAAYLGTNREHKANFETVTSQSADQQAKAQQGIYALSLDYAKDENGGYTWVPKATNLRISPIDYYDAACGQEETPLIGSALSWRGGNCLQTCGDGTYFDQQEGDSGQLCDGNTFHVSRFWKSTSFIKTIQVASELAACSVAGCTQLLLCTRTWETTCINAEAAAATACGPNPAVAGTCPTAQSAKEAACAPKGILCATSTGVAAGLGAAEGVDLLLSQPSGCDQVAELGAGALTYATLSLWPPTSTARSVCLQGLGSYRVGSDMSIASQQVMGACIGMIGAKAGSLVGSWINHAFVDKTTLNDRAYIDINGKSCTNWESNIGKYFVYQDCDFKSLWAQRGETETCSASPNVKLYTKDLNVGGQSGISTNYNGKITFKIKS